MSAALKYEFSNSSEPPDGLGRSGVMSQCVLYPARDNHSEAEEMENAARMAIELAQSQLKSAYSTSYTGRIYDLYVNLNYSGANGGAQITVTCADSVDKVVQKLKSNMTLHDALFFNDVIEL